MEEINKNPFWERVVVNIKLMIQFCDTLKINLIITNLKINKQMNVAFLSQNTLFVLDIFVAFGQRSTMEGGDVSYGSYINKNKLVER